jgi:TRAP-type C4-dicarboxylate transport system permease small subunit
MNLLRRISDALARIERWLLVMLIIVLVVCSFSQVILRNLFSFSYLWTDPLLRYIVMWAGFLGAAVATGEEKHFAVEFVGRFLPPRAEHFLKGCISVASLVVVLLLTRAAYQFLTEGIGADEIDLFDLPKRLYFAIIPAAFGLIAVHFALHAVRHIVSGVRFVPAGPPEAGGKTTA